MELWVHFVPMVIGGSLKIDSMDFLNIFLQRIMAI
jgi:hypothetical protein